MPKTIVFITQRPELAPTDFSSQYHAHAREMRARWPSLSHLMVGDAFASTPDHPPIHNGVAIGWLPDTPSAIAFGDDWTAHAGTYAAIGSTAAVVAEEVIVRGQAYLKSRRPSSSASRPTLKMMTFAKRAPDLTLTELSAQWTTEAGRLGGSTIPLDLLGDAYVQNHVVAVEGREWVYDAVNEVWFEDRHALLRRLDYFAARRLAATIQKTPSIFDARTQQDVAVSDQLVE